MLAASDPSRLWLFYIIIVLGVFCLSAMLVSVGYHQGRRDGDHAAEARVRRAYRRGVLDGREEARRG